MKELTNAELLTLIDNNFGKVLPSEMMRTLLTANKKLTFDKVFLAIQLVLMQKISGNKEEFLSICLKVMEEHERTY